ncbi:MAG: TetR/AcrR family transcriptional regulator [Acidimicrobiales bacterium]|nr:TetR/AcrR family transcriptional regulator [Acidimicrobiales bacterium]
MPTLTADTAEPISEPLAAQIAEQTTEQRLLAVAEQLFAAHGRHGVSGRSITRAAEANVAAINYHFGSLDDLVDAVLRWRMAELLALREQLLERLESARAVELEDIAEVVVGPLARLRSDPDRSAYPGFLHALLTAGGAERERVTAAFRPQLDRIVALLASAIGPGADPAPALRRLGWALDAVVAVLARTDADSASGLADELVMFTAGALRGAPTTTRRGDSR